MDLKKMKLKQLIWGVSFCISSNSPELYLKTVKRLGIYVCTTYKNGSDVQICIKAESLILPEELVLPEKPTAHQKKM